MAQLAGIAVAVGGFVATYGSAIMSVVSVAASIALSFVGRGGIMQEGPRLTDSTVMTSTYGNGIPLIIGRCRVAGNMIWATDIEERKQTRKAGGKGSMFGGSSAKQTTYTYYGNFAMAFGKGDGGGCFAKLFADKKLIYDATGSSEAFFKYNEAAVRFYMGGDDQEPDPLMESVLGAGNVSAHKDLTYVVIENLPLVDFGNRIPHLEAVFDSSAEASTNRELTTGSNLPDELFQDARYDPTTRQLYVVDAPSLFFGSLDFASIWRCDMGSNAEGAYIASQPSGPPYLWPELKSNGVKVGGVFPHTDGKLFVAGETEDGNAVVRINPYTLDPIHFDQYRTWPPDPTGNFKDAASISVTREHPTGIKNYLLLAHDPFQATDESNGKVYIYDRDEEFLSGPQIQLGEVAWATGFHLLGSCADREGIVWMVGVDYSQPAGVNGNRAQLIRIEINRTQNIKLYGIGVADTSAEPKAEVIDLTDTGLNMPSAIAYDPSSHSLIIASSAPDSNNDHKWVRWDIETRSVVVEREFDLDNAANYGTLIQQHRCTKSWQIVGAQNGELMGFGVDNGVRKVMRIRTVDLSHVVEEPPDNVNQLTRMLWDPTQNQAWFLPTGSGTPPYTPQLVQWQRCVETPVPLEDVILELVELTRELGAADIDVTDSGITDQDLRGLIIGRQMPVRRALESLIFPYQLDIVESDAVLKFTTRGGGSVRTVPENDLGAQTRSGVVNKLMIDRSQEAEVPARMDLRYLDWDREFLEGNQSAQRHRNPYSTQYSPEVAQLNVPVVLNAQEAAQAVETGLYNAWVGRTGYKLSLGTKHLDLDPTDVITVERGEDSFLMRLMEWQLEDGFVTNISAASEDQETYASDAVGEEAPTPAQTFGPPGATEMFILDIPLLRDVDDTNQQGTGLYVAFGRHQENWRAAIAERSVDGGLRWDRFSLSRDSAPWGYLTEDVAGLTLESDNTYPSEIQRLDETTEIVVQVVADEDQLESITRLELWLAEDNALIIGEGDAAEILRFQTRVDNGDGTFTLSDLLRGRRGTEESALAGHAAGDRVVFLNDAWVNREGLPLSRIAQPDRYRATSLGEFVEAAAVRSFTVRGNDMRPYPVSRPAASPVHSGAARGTVTLTWNRRSRVAGNYDLLDAVRQDVIPIGEISEEYEVDLREVAATGLDSTTDVNDTTEIITVNGHPWATGDGPIRFLPESGDLPDPLDPLTDYWVIYVGVNTIQVARSESAALNGDEIDLTDAVGTFSITTGDVVTESATSDGTGVQFTAGQVTGAGYTDGDLLHVVIYQISGTVGRGLPRTVSL